MHSLFVPSRFFPPPSSPPDLSRDSLDSSSYRNALLHYASELFRFLRDDPLAHAALHRVQIRFFLDDVWHTDLFPSSSSSSSSASSSSASSSSSFSASSRVGEWGRALETCCTFAQTLDLAAYARAPEEWPWDFREYIGKISDLLPNRCPPFSARVAKHVAATVQFDDDDNGDEACEECSSMQCGRKNVASWGEDSRESECVQLVDEARRLRSVSESFFRDPRVVQWMNRKKHHEVASCIPWIQSVCANTNSDAIVDIGAGQGYVSQSVAFLTQIDTIGVESRGLNVEAASERASLLSAALEEEVPFVATERFVSLHSQLEDTLPEIKGKRSITMCGLHACGDLTSTILRMFSSEENATGLFVVGCCYQWISESGDNGEHCEFGFPLSRTCSEFGLVLGHSARRVGCHCVERWPLDVEESASMMRSHAFRCLLDCVLADHYSDLVDLNQVLQVGSVPQAKDHDFAWYGTTCLTRLGFPLRVNRDDLNAYVDRYLDQFHLLSKFWALKSLFGRLVEAAIVVDRLLFLYERFDALEVDGSAFAVPIFDPVVSPRNFAIVASKKRK